MKLLFALAALGFLVTDAAADQYSCTTVDQSAAAFVVTNVPVSVQESDRQCSLSVDGATGRGDRSGSYVTAVNNLIYELYQTDVGPNLDANWLIDLIVGPFGPDSNEPGGNELLDRVTEQFDRDDEAVMGQCLLEFGKMIGPEFEYGEIYDFGTYESRHLNCRVIMPRGEADLETGISSTKEGALAIDYFVDDTRLSVFIPRDFLVDARDGNGTFN